MHLLIPFAAPLSDAGRQTLASLRLTVLPALLDDLAATQRDEGDAQSLSPPHERVLGRELGLQGADGALPWGAWRAERAGIDTGDRPWGVLTPVHWDVVADGVVLADPAALELSVAESRALFDTVAPLAAAEGAKLVWRGPLVWLATHDALDGLACASVDRVVGRDVEPWLPAVPFVRRLQLEVQMLLHGHPVNARREARGLPPVNSVWVSGCGRRQPAHAAQVKLDDRLRAPALAEDWEAWAAAWQALDAGPLAALRGGRATLTLCGERSAQRFEPRGRSLWQRLATRWRQRDARSMLESL
jgi:hypothetical protein